MATYRQMIFFVVALFVVSAVSGRSFAQSGAFFNVKQYGAVGNGVTLDTAAINRAIEACAKAGGGTVYVPAGTYLTGTVNLKSNITLWLASGATLLGSKNLADYPVGKPWSDKPMFMEGAQVRGSQWFKALVRGENIENVTLEGPGTIDGNNVFNPNGEEGIRGPHGVSIDNCRNLTIRNLTIKNGSNWNLRLVSCKGVNVNGYTVMGGWDGINMNHVSDITISNSRLFSGDDSVAAHAVKNVTITNCLLSSSANAFRYYGENTLISNVIILSPGRFEHRTSHKHTTDAGFLGAPTGTFIMSNVAMMNVRSPIWLNYRRGQPGSHGEGVPPANITINNLTATGLGRAPLVVLADADQPVKSLVLNNVRLNYIGGAREQDSNEEGMSPFSILPWYGFYANSVSNLELHNVRMDFQAQDLRPALLGEDIENLELDGFHAERAEGGDPSVMLENVRHLVIDGKTPSATKLRVVALDVDSRRIIAGEPFQATVTVENSGSEGLGDVQLQLGAATMARKVWLKAGETASVPFANLVVNQAGQQQAQAGPYTKNFIVHPKPSGHPVSAPYVAFDNADGQVQELDGGGFYLKAAADPGQCLWRADTYAAAYLKRALGQTGDVVTRLQNPDGHTGWFGAVGIMVRNDISQPGKSGGYLVLEGSPASGYLMEWASNGSGQVNRHTELAGYTYWPGWLKLERRGNAYTGYYSKDGSTWVKVGQAELSDADAHQDAGVFAHTSSARFTEFKVENQAAQR